MREKSKGQTGDVLDQLWPPMPEPTTVLNGARQDGQYPPGSHSTSGKKWACDKNPGLREGKRIESL